MSTDFERIFEDAIIPRINEVAKTSVKNVLIDLPQILPQIGIYHETSEFNVKEYKFDGKSKKRNGYDDEEEEEDFFLEDDEESKELNILTFLNTLAELLNEDLEYPFVGDDEIALNAPKETLVTPDEFRYKANLDSPDLFNRFLTNQYGLESRLLRILQFCEERTVDVFFDVLKDFSHERFGVSMKNMKELSSISIKKTIIPHDTYIIQHRRTEKVYHKKRILFVLTWELSFSFSSKKLGKLETVYASIKKLKVSRRNQEFSNRFKRFFGDPLWTRDRTFGGGSILVENDDFSYLRLLWLIIIVLAVVFLLKLIFGFFKVLTDDCVECV